MLTKNELIALYGMRTLDYEKDPNPEHWRTISGAKVHLDNNGEIDGGAGGNFNGNYWDGKKGQQHVIGPHTMMKKNIGSGATMFKMAAMGAFNNKVEPTKPAEPVKPAKKPKAPKEPAFEFPKVIQRTTPQRMDDPWVKKQIKNATARVSTHGDRDWYSQTLLDRVKRFTGVPVEEMESPHNLQEVEEQFGSAFAAANNARKKPFSQKDIDKFKSILDAVKNADENDVKAAVQGINVQTLGMEPEKAYKTWIGAFSSIERLNKERENGVSTDYDAWKKSQRGSGKDAYLHSFAREKKIHETPEMLKKQAGVYKPDNIVGVPKGPDMTFEEADHNKANPGYRKIWEPDYKEGYRVNCQTCVVAFEMRLRGYNVEALPQNGWNNPFQLDIAHWNKLENDGSAQAWIRPDGTHPKAVECKALNGEDAYKWLEANLKDGERYTMSVDWRGGGAHIFSIMKKDGKVTIFDAQPGIEYNTEESIRKEYLDKTNYYKRLPRICRIDDCAPNMFYVNRVLRAAK